MEKNTLASVSLSALEITPFLNDQLKLSNQIYRSIKNAKGYTSEVYYPYGWNAYIDGKKVDYCKTNYVLRGLSIPAGQHNVKFIFEPATYKQGVTVAYIASFIILIVFVGGLFMHWRTTRKTKV